MKLNDIFFGDPDGEKESAFENAAALFYDNDNMIESLSSKRKYFVVGRKGAGKTLLCYAYKESVENENHTVDIITCKDISLEEMLQLKGSDDVHSEYKLFWEWMIYLIFAKIIAVNRDTTIPEYNSIVDFLENNQISRDINAKKVIEETKKANFGGSIKGVLHTERGSEVKLANAEYFEYLGDLRDKVHACLRQTSLEHEVIVDNLDDRFSFNSTNYFSWLTSFISAVNDINVDFSKLDISARIVGVLRTDILACLNFPNSNKILMSSKVEIDWGDLEDRTSPLVKMIVHKARKSCPELEELDDRGVLHRLFKGTDSEIDRLISFILERTQLRPRDVIAFFNFAKERNGKMPYFIFDHFSSQLKSYSEYLLDEIKNEMSGHISDEDINELFTYISEFNITEFPYDKFEKFLSEERGLNRDKIRTAVNALYNYGIIINHWTIKKENNAAFSNYYKSSYRNSRSSLDKTKDVMVHKGLWRVMNMG
jgi:hypothetical protein